MITAMNARPTREQFQERLKLASGLQHHGYYEMGREIAEELYLHDPSHAPLCHTLGQIATSQGQFTESLSYHRQAVESIRTHGLPPGNESAFATAAFGLACAEMRQGNFGVPYVWPYWELGRTNISWSVWPGAEYWTGLNMVQPTAGKTDSGTLLISSEGGYGDTFMFMRWLPLIKRRFPKITHIGLMVWPPLADFCDWSSLGVDEIYRIGVDPVSFNWRYSTSIMSMPAIFKLQSWQDIPPYSGLPDEMIWQPSNEPGHKRLGFCWRAEENTSPVRTKSIPLEIAEEIADMLSASGLDLFSLSPEKADLYSSGQFNQPKGLTYEPARMSTWKMTADYLRTMDYVLTVDTAVAHLCGILGVPAMVLLPASSCWRWGVISDDGPWYGPSLRYYRQTVPLEWEAEDIAQRFLSEMER